MILARLPARIAWIICPDSNWFHVGLLSAAVCRVYVTVRWKILPVILHALIIADCVALLVYLRPHVWLFALAVGVLAAVTVSLTCFGKKLRLLANWIFIPSVYLACEMHFNTTTTGRIPAYFLVALAGTLLPLIPGLIREKKYHPKVVLFWSKIHWGKGLPDAFVVAAGLRCTGFVAARVSQLFNVMHSEWMMWSAVSVSTGEIRSMNRKIRYRFTGAITGLAAGVLLLLIFPLAGQISYVWAMLIPVTLIIPVYKIAFTTRCFLIALAGAGASATSMVEVVRMSNVVAGGLIGAAGGYATLYLYARFSQQDIPEDA